MKKTILGLVILAGVSGGAWYLTKTDPVTSPSTSTESVSTKVNNEDSTTDTEDFPTENNPNNPSFHSSFAGDAGDTDLSSVTMYIAQSKDGITFDEPEVFMQGGGVYSGVTADDGTMVVVFQWFPEDKDPDTFNQVAGKISTDNGATWTDPTPLIFKDFPDDYQAPFDPCITTTADGRYRLFFTTHVLDPEAQFVYGSAISDDGIHYTYEGVSFAAPDGTSTVDGSEVRVGDQWIMVAPMAKQNGKALDATSSDGVTFTESTSNRSDDIYWVGNMVNVNGTVRFYGAGKGALSYSATKDGKTWGAVMPTSIKDGGDPAVLYSADGTYFVIYPEPKTRPNMPEDPNSSAPDKAPAVKQ